MAYAKARLVKTARLSDPSGIIQSTKEENTMYQVVTNGTAYFPSFTVGRSRSRSGAAIIAEQHSDWAGLRWDKKRDPRGFVIRDQWESWCRRYVIQRVPG
jgi:hypothetical protein